MYKSRERGEERKKRERERERVYLHKPWVSKFLNVILRFRKLSKLLAGQEAKLRTILIVNKLII